MKGARSLYLVHLGFALMALALIAAAAVVVLAASNLSIPTGAEVSRACARWLGSGGAAAVFGLLVLVLAASLVVKGLASMLRQIRAGRRYLSGIVLEAETPVAGMPCWVFEGTDPVAFCAGYLRPRIYLSRGLLDELAADELQAVAAHEAHHARRRDPLRRLVARTLADALFFVPLLRQSEERYVALGELAADEAAVESVGRRQPLASALLKFAERETTPVPVAGIAPERVDQLVGDRDVARWRLPAALTGLSLAAIVGLAGLLSVTATIGAGIDWPVLLAAGCMLGMVFGPIVLGATALVVSCRALRARRA